MGKKTLLALLVFSFLLVAAPLAYATAPPLPEPTPIICSDKNDCQQKVCGDVDTNKENLFCKCTPICETSNKGLSCETRNISVTKPKDFFEKKAEEYVVAQVGQQFYNSHYRPKIWQDMSWWEYAAADSYGQRFPGIHTTVGVSFDYITEIEEVIGGSVGFDACSGEFKSARLYLEKKPVIITKEEFLKATEEQGVKVVSKDLRRTGSDWSTDESLRLSYDGHSINWYLETPYAHVIVDATTGYGAINYYNGELSWHNEFYNKNLPPPPQPRNFQIEKDPKTNETINTAEKYPPPKREQLTKPKGRFSFGLITILAVTVVVIITVAAVLILRKKKNEN